ncbi:hypothetical protein HELRODRAFT_183602 [Helobdella robusta]|uniref:Uncharacterized protein n=1 Tax=Helobdella robusta TaxID=6412 RepID=T1FJW9_HELRO|nr:hypothetical protein HELRODRAFT_183602 [Helobdella robusta]ESO10444.1 hypothetical protein HELRODRAFT_183602 [Helobdella robusta]
MFVLDGVIENVVQATPPTDIVRQDKATKRGGDHLVSSDGHNLTVKSKTKIRKTTYKGCKAEATGLAKICAKSYQAAMEQPFTSALDIVNKAILSKLSDCCNKHLAGIDSWMPVPLDELGLQKEYNEKKECKLLLALPFCHRNGYLGCLNR